MAHASAIYRTSELIRREEERRRAWLHDTVLQPLEFIATGGYGQCLEADQLMQLAARTAEEVRAAIDGPAPAHLDVGEQLLDVVEEARALSPLHVDLELDPAAAGLLGTLDRTVAAELVALVREALTNVRKHASAEAATVSVRAVDCAIVARVADDGVGFDLRATPYGIGLRCSIRERAARCGGMVDIRSALGNGTVVEARIPLPGASSVTPEERPPSAPMAPG